MKHRSIMILLLSLVVFSSHALAGPPLDTVKSEVNGVLDVLRDTRLKGDEGKKAKEDRITATADQLFDFVELSKRTLGLNWNRFTPDQRKQVVDFYKKILKNTYVDKITAYKNEQVSFTREVPLSADTVEVQSVVAAKGGDVSINYRVTKEGSGWKVYDVVVEGVSLIENYRTQFREILANNPPEALIEILRKKGLEQK